MDGRRDSWYGNLLDSTWRWGFDGECRRNGGVGKLEEDRSIAEGGKIGLEVTDGGGGYVGSGRGGRDVEKRCGDSTDGRGRRTTAPTERRTAMWGARGEGSGGTRLHVSSPGSDRREGAGPATDSLSGIGRGGRGGERLLGAVFLRRGVSEEGIIGLNSGMEVEGHCGAIRDV